MPLEKLDQLDPERLLRHFEAKDQPVSQVSFEVANETLADLYRGEIRKIFSNRSILLIGAIL